MLQKLAKRTQTHERHCIRRRRWGFGNKPNWSLERRVEAINKRDHIVLGLRRQLTGEMTTYFGTGSDQRILGMRNYESENFC